MPTSSKFTIDIHCHPDLKPYGKSFRNPSEYHTQSANRCNKTSLWYFVPPSIRDKVWNAIAGLTKFRQTDFKSSLLGNLRVVFNSLYSPEKGFFDNKLGAGLASDFVTNLVTGFGIKRINFIQSNRSYFADLEKEYLFLKMCEGNPQRIKRKTVTYHLLKSHTELQTPPPGLDQIIYNVVTIEGGHVFDTGFDPINDPAANRKEGVLANVDKVKNWEHKPLFLTLAHHFYNELCGHAKSLDDFVAKFIDQTEGMNTGFTPLGREVIARLLDDTNQKRILIDIKHMSRLSRKEFFDMLNNDYSLETIPIVVSHGCVTGYKDANGSTTFSDAPEKFNNDDINFYDDELVRIAQSGGLFGVQLDERRIASNKCIKKAKGHILRNKILYHWSELIWNQIEHIAKVLDANGLPPWDTACLGSDYDGIVNPIGGFWTSEDFLLLDKYLLLHAGNFTNSNIFNTNQTPEEIVYKFRYGNALEFLKNNY